MNVETLIHDTRQVTNNTNLVRKCLGILAVKDVINDKVLQRGLILIAKYYELEPEMTGSAKIEQGILIEKDLPCYSLFAINCVPHTCTYR